MDAAVIGILTGAAQQGRSVRLLNIYKGVPISNDAELVGMDSNFVHLRTTPYQIACIYLERGTYIKVEGAHRTIRGQLYRVDVPKSEILLTNVVLVSGGIGQREQIRVEPDEAIWVNVQLKNAAAPVVTRLADVSTSGIGVYMERYYFQSQAYQIGAELKVTFDLPRMAVVTTGRLDTQNRDRDQLADRFSREQVRGTVMFGSGGADQLRRDRQPAPASEILHIASRGKVMNVRPELYQDRYRIGIRLLNEDGYSQAMIRYVSQRQSDIIREFRLVYETLARSQQ